MVIFRKIIFILFVLLPCLILGQDKSHDFFIEDEFMHLNIDLRKSNKSIDSLLQIAKINNLSSKDIRNAKFKKLTVNGWIMKNSDQNILQFKRSLTFLTQLNENNFKSILHNIFNSGTNYGYDTDAEFGVNHFTTVTVKELANGLTKFTLPAHSGAKKVILAGSFNNWSVSEYMMTQTLSGWEFTIKLDAGMHLYKFIVDGFWLNDQFNLNKKPDGHDGFNSVYFKYNTEFILSGFLDRSKIILSGAFNSWDKQMLLMQKTNTGWRLPMYLKEGRHEYKFIVDEDWITDPSNALKVPNQEGTYNSVIYIGHQVEFKVSAANAKKVYVAGTFNNWKPNIDALLPEFELWKTTLNLAKGNYQYKFIVDGNWMLDPKNPHNAMDGDIVNSFKAVEPNTSFCIKDFPNAKSVFISGDFNQWDEYGYSMVKIDGCWKIEVYLKPGKHLYKLIVDGKWVKDPTNSLFEPNEFKDYNSVIWVK